MVSKSKKENNKSITEFSSRKAKFRRFPAVLNLKVRNEEIILLEYYKVKTVRNHKTYNHTSTYLLHILQLQNGTTKCILTYNKYVLIVKLKLVKNNVFC